MKRAVEVLEQILMDYKQLVMDGDNDLWNERLAANMMDAQQALMNEKMRGRYLAEQYEFDFRK
jgi:hypothetical protein